MVHRFRSLVGVRSQGSTVVLVVLVAIRRLGSDLWQGQLRPGASVAQGVAFSTRPNGGKAPLSRFAHDHSRFAHGYRSSRSE